MNRHLHPHEFVDAIDGQLAPVRRQHVESCPQCEQRYANCG